jgi:predicted amidophosphoribosyltransferase
MPASLVATIVGITGAAAAVAGTSYAIVAGEDAKKTAEVNQNKALAQQDKAINAAIEESKTRQQVDLANALAGIEALRVSLMGQQAQAQPQPVQIVNESSPPWPLIAAAGIGLVVLLKK